MPKAKPVSLHPLSFEEAIKAIIRVNPGKVGLREPKQKEKSKTKKK
ncbi:MAG: hypothetical protein AB7G68_11830 [Nitrospiraceae bacterium]